MNYKITRYENYGKGFLKVADMIMEDKESKSFVSDLIVFGFKRTKGSGIIGLSFDGETQDKMGKVQITIERVVD